MSVNFEFLTSIRDADYQRICGDLHSRCNTIENTMIDDPHTSIMACRAAVERVVKLYFRKRIGSYEGLTLLEITKDERLKEVIREMCKRQKANYRAFNEAIYQLRIEGNKSAHDRGSTSPVTTAMASAKHLHLVTTLLLKDLGLIQSYAAYRDPIEWGKPRPAAKPTSKPAQRPAAKPTPKPAPKPAPTPAPKPAARKQTTRRRKKGKSGLGAAVLLVLAAAALFFFLNRPEGAEEPAGSAQKPGTAAEMAAVGDVLLLGQYEQDGDSANGAEPIRWIVIDREQKTGEVMLLSENCLDYRPFDEEAGQLQWSQSGLRTWLNGDFLKTAFSADEQGVLRTAEVTSDAMYLDPDTGMVKHTMQETTRDQVYVPAFDGEAAWNEAYTVTVHAHRQSGLAADKHDAYSLRYWTRSLALEDADDTEPTHLLAAWEEENGRFHYQINDGAAFVRPIIHIDAAAYQALQ